MTLADRLNRIIDEQGLTKRAFAKTLGVSENYIYQLTGSQEKLTTISETLAKLIARGCPRFCVNSKMMV